MRRRLDRGYQVQSEALATVRGHIDLSSSFQLQARNVRRLQCEFDELSHDLLHNGRPRASSATFNEYSVISEDRLRLSVSNRSCAIAAERE